MLTVCCLSLIILGGVAAGWAVVDEISGHHRFSRPFYRYLILITLAMIGLTLISLERLPREAYVFIATGLGGYLLLVLLLLFARWHNRLTDEPR